MRWRVEGQRWRRARVWWKVEEEAVEEGGEVEEGDEWRRWRGRQ